MLNRILPLTQQVKESCRIFVQELTGSQVKDTKIKKIRVHSFSSRVKKQIDTDICVGNELDLNLSNIPHEPVLAIFESRIQKKDEYIVVTPNKNNSHGTAYFFEPEEILTIEKET